MDISIQKVAMIILAVAIVLLMLGFFRGSFNEMITGFTDSVSYATPSGS